MVKVIMVIFDLRTRNNINEHEEDFNEHEEDFNEHGIILTNTNLTNLTNFFLCAAIRVIRAIRVQKTKMMSVQKNKNDERRKQSRMLRGALAQAGAHEAPPRRSV